MPAVAPQATSRRNCRGGRTRKRPLNEDSIAASCTMGPSRPMEAPDPMESSEDTLRARVWRKPITRARRRWLPCNRPRRVWAASARPVAEPGRPTRHRAGNSSRCQDSRPRARWTMPCGVSSAQHHLYPGKQLAKHHGGQRAQQSHQGGCEQGVGRFSATNWPRNAPAQRNFPIRIFLPWPEFYGGSCSLLFSGPSTERAHGAWNACPGTCLTGLSGGFQG